MKVIIDANVVIDVLEKREPFLQKSYEVMQLSMSKKIDAFACACCGTGGAFGIVR